jgi:hypothetical protein
MATPRTPKAGAAPDDAAIPDAELVPQPGVDAMPEPEVAAAMSDPQNPPPALPTETDVHPAAQPDPVWTESPAATAFETAPPAPEGPRPDPLLRPDAVPQRGGLTGTLALVGGGILAALIGFGVSRVVPQGWPIGADTGLEATVAAQAAEIARLSESLASPNSSSASPGLRRCPPAR